MTSNEIREKYLKFFVDKGHVEIPPAPLVLESDPTTLFTSAGMQPLIPYLKGEPYLKDGKRIKRLVNVQPSLRLGDIEEVGDSSHTTFFEMLGNWSLGYYFKKEQLVWIWQFFTKELGIDEKKLYVSVFEGNKDIPRDEEAIETWKGLGLPQERIVEYGVDKNWWSRTGEPKDMPAGEIGGPDSEIFYDFGKPIHEGCHPNCNCGRFLEIGNSVFMEYQKMEDGSLKELPQKNVDFGGGLERITVVLNNDPDIFKIDVFAPLIQKIEEITGNSYAGNERSMRIIADHLRAAKYIADEGVVPGNKAHGYILRRLIRRAYDQIHGKLISEDKNLGTTTYAIPTGLRPDVIKGVVGKLTEKDSKEKSALITGVIEKEASAYEHLTTTTTLPPEKNISGKEAFQLHSTHGLSPEQLRMRGYTFNQEEYDKEFKEHQELSRKASAGMFKGGLADNSAEVTKLHTATHLLHTALRKVLGEGVSQKGSNITSERLRFDFSYPQKLTEEELKKVEDLINGQISKKLPVTFRTETLDEAINEGALHFFAEKYGKEVKVYTVGDPHGSWFSKEVCGGPHVVNTSEIGHVKIMKQEKIGAGLMRLYVSLA